MPADDACDVCGRRHATHHCHCCSMRLCDAHHECPECDEESFVPSYPEEYDHDAD
jgi:hypothetical protein